MFATGVPGLGGLLRDEISDMDGLTVTAIGNDGRSDIVLFNASDGREADALGLALAEDVFSEVGRTLRSEGDRPEWITRRIWKSQRAERALTARRATGRPVPSRATFRVIARVLQERSFLRTELRQALTAAVQNDRPQWRTADPAQLELWISEYARGQFVAGLRLSDERMRQHGGRSVERHGALRPTVAAAMVRLAGRTTGLLLDPCCGSGTILAEAERRGWQTIGCDIDPKAVEAARENVPTTEITEWDVRHLGLADASVDASVTNLPFGHQFEINEPMDDWLRKVIRELARVTRPGGRVVLLAPNVPGQVKPPTLNFVRRTRLQLLGMATSIWTYQRAR